MTRAAIILTFLVAASLQIANASPIYADGDLAPIGSPDGRIDIADYLIATRVLTGKIAPTELEYSHGDLYPVGAPDGVFNVQDLLLIQKLLLGEGAGIYVQNLDLFVDGPATFTIDINGNIGSTDLVVGGYIGPGAVVINDPNFIDPVDASNTVWRVDISGGTANAYMGTASLSSDTVLDSGFDLSGPGGQLVFDIKVNSISPGTALIVKIDSGYPNLGQVALVPAQYTVGSWRRVVIDFATLLANPGPGGASLDLENVANAFVIEVVGGAADFYLDNIFITHACSEAGGCNATVKTKAVIDYELVWNDEFDGTSLSLENWQYETGYGGDGWGNFEWQRYTSNPDNVAVENGNLRISAQCANPPNCGERNETITSARINSLNKFAFKFGKVEARIKPPVGKGAWPAFWLLGKNFPYVGWPFSGELDVVEMNNRYSNEYTTHFTMHWFNETAQNPPTPGGCSMQSGGWTYISCNESFFPVSLGDDFHIFSAEWDAERVVGKIDGVQYFNLPIDPGTMEEFLEEFFMILNVAMGGTLGGVPDASTPWPQTMLVDYVRVYQEVGGDGTYTIGPPPLAPELGVYSESHTESSVPVNITNGADFNGNVLIIDATSTTVSFDGSVSLEVEYLNSGRSFGGFLFSLGGGQDISGYQMLKFSIDQSAMLSMENMSIELENPGQQKFVAQLANYTPTVSGNWATYEVPLGDFTGADLTNIVYLGFWTPRTAGGSQTFGTLYYDDIHFAGGQ